MLKVAWWVNAIRLFCIAVILLFVIMALYPLFWMVMTAFKTYAESITWPPTLFPNEFLLDNFRTVFAVNLFWRFFGNTAVYAIVGTLLTVSISAMAGYAFAKFVFPGRHLLFLLVLSTMMIPAQVTLVPVFLICSSFGWINTFMGLIIPGLASAFGIFMVRQFAQTLPNDFFDAARVDGASQPRIFLQIFIPLIMPAITTLIVLDFMGRWNDLFWPLIIAGSRNMKTLQLALQSEFRTLYDTRWSELAAAMCIAAFPVLLLYTLFQKYFTKGIVLTSGIKG